MLLATDLAARGLDIPEVQWVVQVRWIPGRYFCSRLERLPLLLFLLSVCSAYKHSSPPEVENNSLLLPHVLHSTSTHLLLKLKTTTGGHACPLSLVPLRCWMQVDAPQDPSAFVHRVGRTARAGKAGAALLYLAPHETSYVDFLTLRKVCHSHLAADPAKNEWL